MSNAILSSSLLHHGQLLLLLACFPLLCHGIPPPAQVARKLLKLGSNIHMNTHPNTHTHVVRQLQQTADEYCQEVESLITDDVWTAAPLDCDCTRQGALISSYHAFCTQTEPICLQINSESSSTLTGYRVSGTSSFVIQNFWGVLECFDYEEQHHEGAKVCYTYTKNTCEVSVNGVVCDSCEFCDPARYLMQVDCRNVLLLDSEVQVLDECQDPNNTTSQGTFLEFAYATACRSSPLDPICVKETTLLLQNSSIASEFDFITDAVPEICNDVVGLGSGGQQCLWNHSVIDHNLPHLCEQAGGFYWQGTFEIRCESLEGMPTFYYVGTQVPDCSSSSCAPDSLLLNFSLAVGDLADSIGSNGYGTCTSTVGWGNIALEGPYEVASDILCMIIEQDIADPKIFSDTNLTCTCTENTDDSTIISAKCRHPDLLCLESSTASTDTKPFLGQSTYSVEVKRQGFNTLAYSHCFDYQILYEGATVCLDLDRLGDSCQVMVNGNPCDTCQVCNPSELFVTADCTNLLPETEVINQCTSPLLAAQSPLRFYAFNVTGIDTCGVNNSSASQPPIAPDDSSASQAPDVNSTSPTCVLQMATDSCKDLAALGKTIMAETQLLEDCDCHNFCNGEWIGCVAFGEESSESMCDQSQVVAGCTTDILDELPKEMAEVPKQCPLSANANSVTCAPLLQHSTTEKCECYNFCDGEFTSCSDKQDQDASLDCSGILVAGCTTDLMEENVNNVERGSGASSIQMRLLDFDSLMVSTTLAMLVFFLR